MTVHLGICCALSAEARTLTDRKIDPGEIVTLNARTRLLLSGMGAERARKAAELLIDSGSTGLLSWGVAAALAETLKPGSLILPREVLSATGERFPAYHSWHAELSSRFSRIMDVHKGILVESLDILTDAHQKRGLLLTHGAIAADMESAAIAAVAKQAKVDYMAIRAISDTVSMCIPRSVAANVDPAGRIGLRTVLNDIVLSPRVWPDVARLGLGMRAACDTLKKVGKFSANSLCCANGSSLT